MQKRIEMNMWANFGISEVRYDDQHSHIEKAKVHQDNGDSMGDPKEWSRDQIIAAIGLGITFVTILKVSDINWKKGQDVNIVTVNEVKYIRTDKNQKASDNLESLPEY
jgi:hypothetical protein